MEDMTFTNNGDMSKDAIDRYGSGVITASTTEISISAALSSPATYPSSTLGQALITLVRSVQIDYKNMWFDNNWKIETDYGTRA